MRHYYDNILGVYKDNEVAIRLYKKFGFKKKETNTEEKTGEKYLTLVREGTILTPDFVRSFADDSIEETYRDQEISKPYFIKSKDGVDNACVMVRNYSKPMRGRSSMLILREQGGKLFVYLRKNKVGSLSTIAV